MVTPIDATDWLRDEEAAGSNPATPTKNYQVMPVTCPDEAGPVQEPAGVVGELGQGALAAVGEGGELRGAAVDDGGEVGSGPGPAGCGTG